MPGSSRVNHLFTLNSAVNNQRLNGAGRNTAEQFLDRRLTTIDPTGVRSIMAIKVLARKLTLGVLAFGMFGGISIAAAAPAWCGTCITNCYGYGSSQQCYTNCF